MERLGELFDANFQFKETETPVDATSNEGQGLYTWRQNYYLSGLPTNICENESLVC